MTENDYNETLIIELASKGDREACTLLVGRYNDALLGYISKIIPNTEDARDICQESFQKCFRNLSQYNNRYAFSTWLYTIAQNSALDFLRKRRIPPASSINEESHGNQPINSMVPSPEEDMINDQAIERLIRAIQKMPDIYRKVAELRFIHDYPLDEIAKELNLPLNTVKTRVNRSKKHLHKIWKS
ncbi:ECF RNA polymerase sigma factor SigW [bioreactor metagenome]|uniref:ECF RNA polymerase sigma factor SigW n=1 Tax=bioreactor metagenome TaxID=1076179 RepID=A0A644Y6S9_9ZZZZ|nr:sigma-70 family RNA polymerase sigma factor [Rikenellaceae bacterium]